MPKIMFDCSHNEYLRIGKQGYEYFDILPDRLDWKRLAASLVCYGFDICSIDRGVIPDNLIDLCDIFVIGDPESYYYHVWPVDDDPVKKIGFFSENELKAIREFVFQGGGLFLSQEKYGERKRGNNLNMISDFFGVHFNNDLVESNCIYGGKNSWIRISNLSEHPITENIDQFVIFEGCSITIIPPAEGVEVVPLAFTDRGSHPKSSSVLVTARYGKGKVVFLCDTTLFTELGLSEEFECHIQHKQLLWNIFRWLTPSSGVCQNQVITKSTSIELLSPYIINSLEAIQKNNVVFEERYGRIECALRSIETLANGLSREIEESHVAIDTLESNFEQFDKKSFIERSCDILSNVGLTISSLAITLYLSTNIGNISNTGIVLILISSLVASFVLKALGVPLIKNITRKDKKKGDR